MKKITALLLLLFSLFVSGVSVHADAGTSAPNDHYVAAMATGQIDSCAACHAKPPDKQATQPLNANTTNRPQWGIKPQPYYRAVNWTPD